MGNDAHPDHWSNGPRVGARGVVVVDGQILLLRYERDGEVLYLYPGGGHDAGETLAETAEREVYEETGLRVKAGRLLVVHELQPSKGLAPPDDMRSIYVSDAHRVDFFFGCEVVGTSETRVVPNADVLPDNLHTGFLWVALEELEDYPVIPEIGQQIRNSLGRFDNPLLSES